MGRFSAKLIILAAMLIGLPLLGVVLTGQPAGRYLEFPPRTHYVHHAGFSWAVFIALGAFVGAVVAPLAVRAFAAYSGAKHSRRNVRAFPWWGWLGVLCMVVSWAAAWSRLEIMRPVQVHTFTPLWLSFIVVMNALTWRREGRCALVREPGFLVSLFPASALFWWFFEYLNRFVQNWYYQGVLFDSWEYVLYASISFSTVLPAVFSAAEWFSGLEWVRRGFRSFAPVPMSPKKLPLAGCALFFAGAGLFLIGVVPSYLFPFLWLSPFVILVSLESLMGYPPAFREVENGDWTTVVSFAAGALFCGFFWEMWNYGSLARWEYSIPFVMRYRVFEMPLLGYAGYLPFGLECFVAGSLVREFSALRKGRSSHTP